MICSRSFWDDACRQRSRAPVRGCLCRLVRMYPHACTYAHMCMHVGTCACTCMHVHVCAHTHKNIMHACVCACAYVWQDFDER